MRGFRIAVGVGLVAATASANPKKDPPPAAQLEDTCLDKGCTKHALDHFNAAVTAQKAGKADRALRISYFGDSLTADDHIAHGLRERLGAQLGGVGGPGYVFAVAPHPYCHHTDVTRWVSGDWNVHGVSTTMPADRLLGFGGSAESIGGGTIRFVPAQPIKFVDVHYLEQPRGGSLAVVADGKEIGSQPTLGEAKKAQFYRVEVPDGTKKVELRTTGKVRLFGASLEAARGAVVDNLGVVNATAKGFAQNDMPDHLRNQLAHRSPDLVIIMLGTNEAEWLVPKTAGMTEHEQVFGDFLTTIRDANPGSSCLVISPLDQIDWRDEEQPPRRSIPAMVDAQHRAATAHGCAFWDIYQWMGGRGASRQWFRRGLIVSDYQHPTTAGDERIVDALFAGLIHGS